jgi:acetyl-CoA acetyltransferase
MTDAFVLGGVRTPVRRSCGSLSHLRVDDLLGRTDELGVGSPPVSSRCRASREGKQFPRPLQ